MKDAFTLEGVAIKKALRYLLWNGVKIKVKISDDEKDILFFLRWFVKCYPFYGMYLVKYKPKDKDLGLIEPWISIITIMERLNQDDSDTDKPSYDISQTLFHLENLSGKGLIKKDRKKTENESDSNWMITAMGAMFISIENYIEEES